MLRHPAKSAQSSVSRMASPGPNFQEAQRCWYEPELVSTVETTKFLELEGFEKVEVHNDCQIALRAIETTKKRDPDYEKRSSYVTHGSLLEEISSYPNLILVLFIKKIYGLLFVINIFFFLI